MFVLWASPNVGTFITYRADPDLIAPQLDPTTTIPLLLGSRTQSKDLGTLVPQNTIEASR